MHGNTAAPSWLLTSAVLASVAACGEPVPPAAGDLQYRVAVAWQNVGYNQPPDPSSFWAAE